MSPRIPTEVLQQAIETEFACERCGHCCTGNGAVRIGVIEADRLAKFLGLPRRKFLKQYARQITPTEWWLLDQDNPDQWCIFLEQGPDGLFGCRVNAAKPDQCRSFPAKWRNPGSLKTCAGLRTLVAKLKEREQAKENSRADL